jgi:DDE superfamily endonuclease
VAAAADLAGERRPRLRRKKGAIVRLYTEPPDGATVLCLDEFGPVAARSYPGPSWSADCHRPHFRPDYSRHGYVWAYGALAHRAGAVRLEVAGRRNTRTWLAFLDGLERLVPEGEVYLIVDALPLHWTLDTMLWNWGHRRFHFVPVPKAAAWLNLIEGFWKVLGQRAPDGRDCRSTQEVTAALDAGVADWNEHPTPFLWGRPPKPKRQFKRSYVYRI